MGTFGDATMCQDLKFAGVANRAGKWMDMVDTDGVSHDVFFEARNGEHNQDQWLSVLLSPLLNSFSHPHFLLTSHSSLTPLSNTVYHTIHPRTFCLTLHKKNTQACIS